MEDHRITRIVDRDKAAQGVKMLLEALGQDLTREGLKETPYRVADMYIDHCTPADPELHRVFGEEQYDEMIMVRDIPFSSCCEHHMVFYWGKAHIAYIPSLSDGKILGISKLARLVYAASRGFTIQERITRDIAESMMSSISPYGVMVVIEAEHGCISCRGAKALGSSTVTSAVRGIYRDSQVSRQECLDLMLKGRSR